MVYFPIMRALDQLVIYISQGITKKAYTLERLSNIHTPV